MKMTCINNHGFEEEMTIGNSYTVESVANDIYKFVDNNGNVAYAKRNRFKEMN